MGNKAITSCPEHDVAPHTLSPSSALALVGIKTILRAMEVAVLSKRKALGLGPWKQSQDPFAPLCMQQKLSTTGGNTTKG